MSFCQFITPALKYIKIVIPRKRDRVIQIEMDAGSVIPASIRDRYDGVSLFI